MDRAGARREFRTGPRTGRIPHSRGPADNQAAHAGSPVS